MKVKKLLVVSLAALLLAGCNNGGGNPTTGPSGEPGDPSSEPTSQPAEKTIDLPTGSFSLESASDNKPEYSTFFKFNTTEKKVEITKMPDLATYAESGVEPLKFDYTFVQSDYLGSKEILGGAFAQFNDDYGYAYAYVRGVFNGKEMNIIKRSYYYEDQPVNWDNGKYFFVHEEKDIKSIPDYLKTKAGKTFKAQDYDIDKGTKRLFIMRISSDLKFKVSYQYEGSTKEYELTTQYFPFTTYGAGYGAGNRTPEIYISTAFTELENNKLYLCKDPKASGTQAETMSVSTFVFLVEEA